MGNTPPRPLRLSSGAVLACPDADRLDKIARLEAQSQTCLCDKDVEIRIIMPRNGIEMVDREAACSNDVVKKVLAGEPAHIAA